MDEDNYRRTYREINELACVFEKAVLHQCCKCHRAKHFNLAERIGVACTSAPSQQRCRNFLQIMRRKSVFTLQLPAPESSPLPHAKEIKIQCGGAIGIQNLLQNSEGSSERDIDMLLDRALENYRGLEALPYDQIVRSVSGYEARKSRKK